MYHIGYNLQIQIKYTVLSTTHAENINESIFKNLPGQEPVLISWGCYDPFSPSTYCNLSNISSSGTGTIDKFTVSLYRGMSPFNSYHRTFQNVCKLIENMSTNDKYVTFRWTDNFTLLYTKGTRNERK